VSEKTIQRDIDDLRIYLAGTHFSHGKVSIKYDRTRCGYYLIRMERECFTNEEVLSICKVLLESRAFCKDELDPLLTKLLIQVTPTDRKRVQFMYPGELRKVNFEYSGPSIEAVWTDCRQPRVHYNVHIRLDTNP